MIAWTSLPPGPELPAEAEVGRAQRPRVLYVVGAARSGTTIMDALLGAHASIAAVGELRFLLEMEHGAFRRCACGRLVAECPVWGEVLRRWIGSIGPGGDRTHRVLSHRYERFLGFPWLVFDMAFRRENFVRYRAATAALFAAILYVSGAELIADSSKSPARVLVLKGGHLADLRVVHLVRDPRAAVWSMVKGHERLLGRRLSPFGRAAFALRRVVQWLVANAISEILVRWGGSGMRARYEDLIQDPEGFLSLVGELAGVDLRSIGVRAKAGEAFGYGHIVAGNLRRFTGPAALELDTDWITGSPVWMRRMVWLLACPQARRYGYRR